VAFQLVLQYHGGMCCGVAHINGFPYKEEDTQCPAFNAAAARRYNESGYRVAHCDFPAESIDRRLDRLIYLREKDRRSGVIECILKEPPEGASSHAYDQKAVNEERLLSRGFVLVKRIKNSNSGNMINIYHRYAGEVPPIDFVPDAPVETEAALR
jgi:hypothetical protein